MEIGHQPTHRLGGYGGKERVSELKDIQVHFGMAEF